MQDIPDRDAQKRLAAACLVRAETIIVNCTPIPAVVQFFEVFARVALRRSAAGPATPAEGFPFFLLCLLPKSVTVFFGVHYFQGYGDDARIV